VHEGDQAGPPAVDGRREDRVALAQLEAVLVGIVDDLSIRGHADIIADRQLGS
jgi:hypothetical protein